MLNVIKHRLDVWKEEPSYWNQIAAMDKRLYGSTIPKSLIEIIKIRVSQINKCVFCIDYHTQEALQGGETPRRIFALTAWQESPLFTNKEKIALQAAEEITHISVNGLRDETYEELKKFFTIREIADIIVCV